MKLEKLHVGIPTTQVVGSYSTGQRAGRLLFTRQTNFLLTRSHLVRAVDSIPKFFIAPDHRSADRDSFDSSDRDSVDSAERTGTAVLLIQL